MQIRGILTATAALLTFVVAAHADGFQYTTSSNLLVTVSNLNNDSFQGIYQTNADAFGTQTSVHATALGGSNTPLPDVIFSLAAGSTITSATLKLLLPVAAVQGTSQLSIDELVGEGIPPPDPSNPLHIKPTFSNPGTSQIESIGIFIAGFGLEQGSPQGSFDAFDLSSFLKIDGSQVFSTNLASLPMGWDGTMSADVATQGYNWAGYTGGTGQAQIPFTLEIDGTFTPPPAPEPSSFVLLGTGALLIARLGMRRSRLTI